MGWSRLTKLIVCTFALSLLAFSNGVGLGQTISPTPRFGSDAGITGRPTPSRPLSYPPNPARASDSLTLSSAMFQGLCPPVPNLQLGYIFYFGPRVRTGRGIADFVLPLSIGTRSVVFVEAHGEFQNLWRILFGGERHRTDLAFGGGFRTVLQNNTFLGVNAFYDTTSFGSYGKWYSSGGIGFEMVSLLPGGGEMNVEFNYYGDIFSGTGIANWFRHGPRNFDIQAAYSTPLYYGGPRLELRGTGYRFDLGDRNVYGSRLRALLASNDNVFQLRYEVGQDQIDSTYHSIGGYVNIPLQLENLFSGASPFAWPETTATTYAYKPCAEECDKRFIRYLSRPVNRNYFRPASVVVDPDGGGGGGNGGNGGQPFDRATEGCDPVNANANFRNCCFDPEVDRNDLNDPTTITITFTSGFLRVQSQNPGTTETLMLYISRPEGDEGCSNSQTATQRVFVCSVSINTPVTGGGQPLEIPLAGESCSGIVPLGSIPFNPRSVSLELTSSDPTSSNQIRNWNVEVTFNDN